MKGRHYRFTVILLPERDPDFSGYYNASVPALPGCASYGANKEAEEPERCAGIVLVDGGFFDSASFETWEETEQAISSRPLDGLKVEAFLTGARALPDYAGIWSPEVEEILLANVHILSDGTIRSRLRPEQRLKIARANYDHKPCQFYERIRCRVLIVAPTDATGDERAARWIEYRRAAVDVAQQRLSTVEVVWMDKCTHHVPLQRPKELAAAIERWRTEI